MKAERVGNCTLVPKEMKLEDSVVKTASSADIALVIIGRTAGEDQDNKK